MKGKSVPVPVLRVRTIGVLVILLFAICRPDAWAQAGGVIKLFSTPNPAVQGQTVTFTAYVTFAGSPVTAGSVSFADGTSQVATISLDSTGAAIWSTSTLSVGVHTIVASFGGASAQPLIQTILSSFTPTAAVVGSSLNPSSQGQAVTFTARIIAPNSTTNPAGTVTFFDGSTAIGTAPVITSGTGSEFFHLATLAPISSLTPGSHLITAVYGGDNTYAGSTSAILTQVVQSSALPTTTSVTSSLNPAMAGQSVTFTVQVQSSSTSDIPTGTVALKDGVALLATLSLDASGQAAFTTSSLIVGSHAITATYGGDINFAVSVSASLVQVVQPVPAAATTTTLVSSANPSTVGQAVTLTATVTSTNGAPSGSVDFREGSVVLATVSLDASGVATLSTSSLTVGTHLLSAVFSGNASFATSSASLNQVVNPPQQASTTIDLASSANPSSYGQTISFTVTVSGSGGTPTGSVSFNLGSSVFAENLDSAGQAVFTTSALPVGVTSIAVIYSGDPNFSGSTSSLNQVVNRAATTTALSSSANPSSFGAAITFTAAATSDGGIPTGTVTFSVGSDSVIVPLSDSGVAVFTPSTLPVGSIAVSAGYSGDTNFQASASQPITQVVVPLTATADLAISQNTDDKTAKPGGKAEYVIRVINKGPDIARALVVSNSLPAGTVFLSAEPNRGACTTPRAGATGALTCRLDVLSATRSSWVIEFKVRVVAPAGSVLTNSATVSSSTPDPNAQNNSATVQTRVVADDDDDDD